MKRISSHSRRISALHILIVLTPSVQTCLRFRQPTRASTQSLLYSFPLQYNRIPRKRCTVGPLTNQILEGLMETYLPCQRGNWSDANNTMGSSLSRILFEVNCQPQVGEFGVLKSSARLRRSSRWCYLLKEKKRRSPRVSLLGMQTTCGRTPGARFS